MTPDDDLRARAEQWLQDRLRWVPNEDDFPDHAGQFKRETQCLRDLLEALSRQQQENKELLARVDRPAPLDPQATAPTHETKGAETKGCSHQQIRPAGYDFAAAKYVFYCVSCGDTVRVTQSQILATRAEPSASSSVNLSVGDVAPR